MRGYARYGLVEDGKLRVKSFVVPLPLEGSHELLFVYVDMLRCV